MEMILSLFVSYEFNDASIVKVTDDFFCTGESSFDKPGGLCLINPPNQALTRILNSQYVPEPYKIVRCNLRTKLSGYDSIDNNICSIVDT